MLTRTSDAPRPRVTGQLPKRSEPRRAQRAEPRQTANQQYYWEKVLPPATADDSVPTPKPAAKSLR